MATILTIIPYKFYPPIGGGALRCFYLLREMARRHTVYLLTAQEENDFDKNALAEFSNNVKIISSAKTRFYSSVFNHLPTKIANAINFRILNRSLSASTDTSFLRVYPVLKTILDEVKFDVIFYENLEALSLFGNTINRKNPSAIKVYDAHNIDSDLWMQKSIAENNVLYKQYARKALATEKWLYKNVDAFFCCSTRDNEKLTEINQHRISGTVVPNGVDTELNRFDLNREKHLIHNLIFCGSLDYFPNKEGLLWFYNFVFPVLKERMPFVTLTIIGNVSEKDDYEFLQPDPSIKFVGRVESVSEYYYKSSVSIVPLKSGSGTRLKILEAMSLGSPVVSTSVGAEGIEYVDGKHLVIADEPKMFAEAVFSLLNNQETFNEVRANALKLVKEKYDWKIIGKQLNEAIDVLFDSKKEVTTHA